ncbi:MAG TPA: hypothetical protein VL494_13365 [Steroidobacteraceae bacterium]|jgi:hypothetical protein|nr:hypothetical protein [Steroidobacteraceae bacterium]
MSKPTYEDLAAENAALKDLLFWAGKPGHQVFTIDGDTYYAHNGDEALVSAETPEELCGLLGIGDEPKSISEQGGSEKA